MTTDQIREIIQEEDEISEVSEEDTTERKMYRLRTKIEKHFSKKLNDDDDGSKVHPSIQKGDLDNSMEIEDLSEEEDLDGEKEDKTEVIEEKKKRAPKKTLQKQKTYDFDRLV